MLKNGTIRKREITYSDVTKYCWWRKQKTGVCVGGEANDLQPVKPLYIKLDIWKVWKVIDCERQFLTRVDKSIFSGRDSTD